MIGTITGAMTGIRPGIFAGGAIGTGGRTINPQTQLNQLPPTNSIISSTDRMPPSKREIVLATCALANPFLARKAIEREEDYSPRYNLAV